MPVYLIAVVALMSVVGFLAAGLGLILLTRDFQGGLAWFAETPRGRGVLALLAGGCVLAVGGQYKLARILHHRAGQAEERARQAEAYARQQVALQGPPDVLTLFVVGEDPLRKQPDRSMVRLRFRGRTGPGFVSEVSPSQMKALKLDEQGQSPHRLTWQTIVENATDAEGRAVAAGVASLNDLRRFSRAELEVVVRPAKGGTPPAKGGMPEKIWVSAGEAIGVPLLDAQRAPAEAQAVAELVALASGPLQTSPLLVSCLVSGPLQTSPFFAPKSKQPAPQVAAYWDEGSLDVRLSSPAVAPQDESAGEAGNLLIGSLVAGALLLAVGLGFLLQAQSPTGAAPAEPVPPPGHPANDTHASPGIQLGPVGAAPPPAPPASPVDRADR
jgi:hypothetical protein